MALGDAKRRDGIQLQHKSHLSRILSQLLQYAKYKFYNSQLSDEQGRNEAYGKQETSHLQPKLDVDVPKSLNEYGMHKSRLSTLFV
eukprot:scaffold8559_cov135-Skeletonema_marinoi.AAC.5